MVNGRPQQPAQHAEPTLTDVEHQTDVADLHDPAGGTDARPSSGNGRSVPKVLTTGQVARICNVAPRTVSKWFDLGQLRGYRIPGSRDRRIPLDQLLRFMKLHDMPLNGLDAGPRRVVLVLDDEDLARTIRSQLEQAAFQVHAARNGFEAGLLVERLRPHAVVLDTAECQALSAQIACAIRVEPHLADVKLLALTNPDAAEPGPAIPRRGFDARLARPFSITQLIDSLYELTG